MAPVSPVYTRYVLYSPMHRDARVPIETRESMVGFLVNSAGMPFL